MKPGRLFLLLSLLAVFNPTVFPGDLPASSQFSLLQNLVGDWVKVSDPSGPVISSYRVTAAGNAVIETLFPGTDHEMVTVYHLNSDQLVLTHYCVEGNQPHMAAKPASSPDALHFECIEGSSVASEDDVHMHRAEIQRLDDQHLRTKWYRYNKGINDYTADFNLVRRGN